MSFERRRGMLGLALALAAAGCERPPAPAPDPPDPLDPPVYRAGPASGLRVLATSPQQSGHLQQIVDGGDAVWVANSNDGLATRRLLAAPPGLGVDRLIPAGLDGVSCTRLAKHPALPLLYCASSLLPGGARPAGVALFDVSDPGLPAVRDPLVLAHEGLRARDLSLWGPDLLLLATSAGPLLRSPLDAAGRPGATSELLADADVHLVATAGALAAAVTSTRGLVRLARVGETITETGSLPLEGPPLDLVLRGTRAAIALGSRGFALVDLSGPLPVLEALGDPRCVVVSVALRDDALAIGCTTGVALYELAAGGPRLAGWMPARQVVLGVRFVAGGLVVSDWHHLVLAAVDVHAEPAGLQAPRGLYVRPDLDVPIALRNPGARAVDVRLFRRGDDGSQDVLATTRLEPLGERTVSLPSAAVTAARGTSTALEVHLAGRIEGLDDGPPELSGAHFEQTTLVIQAGEPWPPLPALGDTLPGMRVTDDAGEPLDVPPAGARTRLVFASDGCAGQFPFLADLAWLARDGGRTPDDRRPIVLAFHPRTRHDFDRFLRLGPLGWGVYPLLGRPFESSDLVPTPNPAALPDAFGRMTLLGGPDGHLEYLVDAHGRIEDVQFIYRGLFPR